MSRGPIMIVAGGTGGHVFPGIAVADMLREQAQAVVWMGTHRGLEARVVPEAGIEIEWITVSGLRGHGMLAWLAAPFRLVLAVRQALAAMRRRRPSAVLGMGGFVSGPGGIAAWLTRRPLLIHEQNAAAGAANRLLARLTRHVYSAYSDSFPARVTTHRIGNPVRAEILNLPAPAERFAARRAEPYRLLVIGGSQGARTLNVAVPRAVVALAGRIEIEVLHQAGAGADAARAAYGAASGVRVEAFIDDMAAAYAWADLVVCRAGALTTAELAAAGVGAVLIPYPHAADDHQQKNAVAFAANGAGRVIGEAEIAGTRLADELGALLSDRAGLLVMAQRAREQACPAAAAELAAACLAVAEQRR